MSAQDFNTTITTTTVTRAPPTTTTTTTTTTVEEEEEQPLYQFPEEIKVVQFDIDKPLGFAFNFDRVDEIDQGGQADNQGVSIGYQILAINEEPVQKYLIKPTIAKTLNDTKQQKKKFFSITFEDNIKVRVFKDKTKVGFEQSRGMVTYVETGDQADLFGVRIGWKIGEINGTFVSSHDCNDKLQEAFKDDNEEITIKFQSFTGAIEVEDDDKDIMNTDVKDEHELKLFDDDYFIEPTFRFWDHQESAFQDWNRLEMRIWLMERRFYNRKVFKRINGTIFKELTRENLKERYDEKEQVYNDADITAMLARRDDLVERVEKFLEIHLFPFDKNYHLNGKGITDKQCEVLGNMLYRNTYVKCLNLNGGKVRTHTPDEWEKFRTEWDEETREDMEKWEEEVRQKKVLKLRKKREREAREKEIREREARENKEKKDDEKKDDEKKDDEKKG